MTTLAPAQAHSTHPPRRWPIPVCPAILRSHPAGSRGPSLQTSPQTPHRINRVTHELIKDSVEVPDEPKTGVLLPHLSPVFCSAALGSLLLSRGECSLFILVFVLIISGRGC